MDMKSRQKVILVTILFLCVILIFIAILQFVNISQQNKKLTEVQQTSTQLVHEIDRAKKELKEVSSKNYQEQQARKKGYGYPNEKRFLEK